MTKTATKTDFAAVDTATAFEPQLRLETDGKTAQRELDDLLTDALIDSFPASDPVSSLRLA